MALGCFWSPCMFRNLLCLGELSFAGCLKRLEKERSRVAGRSIKSFLAPLYGLPTSHSQGASWQSCGFGNRKYLQNIFMIRMKFDLAVKILLILFQCKTIKTKLVIKYQLSTFTLEETFPVTKHPDFLFGSVWTTYRVWFYSACHLTFQICSLSLFTYFPPLILGCLKWAYSLLDQMSTFLVYCYIYLFVCLLVSYLVN